MHKRRLGNSDLDVSALGLGCMSMSGAYGPGDDEASIAVIHRALDLGVNFFDTSDSYGWGHNETLLGQALRGRRKQVIIATKFGQQQMEGGLNAINGRPEYVARACDASLKRLGIDVIDLYYQHRVDTTVPIEDTVGAMQRLVERGKVRYLGLSEASPATVVRAHAVHPMTAAQMEYSLLYRVEAEQTLPTLRRLGTSLIAYSPLGRSLLTGDVHTLEDLPADDRRRLHPRFEEKNLETNAKLVREVEGFAKAKRCTPGQLAIAWLLAQGQDIVPIPGTKRRPRLEENLGALEVELSPDDIARISEAVPPGAAAGTRYPEPQMKAVFI